MGLSFGHFEDLDEVAGGGAELDAGLLGRAHDHFSMRVWPMASSSCGNFDRIDQSAGRTAFVGSAPFRWLQSGI